MTEIARRRPAGNFTAASQVVAGALVSRLPNGASITGSVAEVSAALAVIRRTGRLTASTMPTPTGIPGQVIVNCTLTPPARPKPPPPAKWWTRGRVITVVVAALGAGGIACLLLIHFVVITLAGAGVVAGGAAYVRSKRRCTTIVTVTHRH